MAKGLSINIMKKALKDYFEIFLVILTIVGLFMPYVGKEIPFDYIFMESMDLLDAFFVTIPIVLILPFLLILIFKNFLKNSLLKFLIPFFLFVYIIVLGAYCYAFYESLNSIFGASLEIIIAILLSLNLLVLNLKYSTVKSDELQNIFLAIMTFPFIFFFNTILITWYNNFNYGGYIINISFILLYVLAVYNIYKSYRDNANSQNDKF